MTQTPVLRAHIRALMICTLLTPAYANANVVTFDPPGSVQTSPASINDGGAIAGTYFDSDFLAHGFVRAPDGTIATFDLPGATFGSYVTSINGSGTATGYYYDSDDDGHGFVRTLWTRR